MADRLNPGIGEKLKIEKRSATSERFIGQFTGTQIIAKDIFGNDKAFHVLAIPGMAKTLPPLEYGAFWGLYVKKGDIYLQGGTAGGKTIKDIKVISKNGSLKELSGKTLWVKITYSGVLANGVIVPGVKVANAICSASSTTGTSIPENTYPSAKSSADKNIYVEVGRWTEKRFLPAGVGNIYLDLCFKVYR